MKIEKDKLLHVAVGAFIAFGLYWLAWFGKFPPSLLCLGVVVAMIAGYVKEDYDANHPESHTYDGWDAYATGAGGWFGFFLAQGLSWLFPLYGIVIQQ